MDEEYLKQHPELVELSRKVSQEQVRTFRRQQKIVSELAAELERLRAIFQYASEAELQILLSKAKEIADRAQAFKQSQCCGTTTNAGTATQAAKVDVPVKPLEKPPQTSPHAS